MNQNIKLPKRTKKEIENKTKKIQESRKEDYINLTPHTITFIGKRNETVVDVDGYIHDIMIEFELSYPPSGHVARVRENIKEKLPIGYISCVEKEYGEIEGIPEISGLKRFLVSKMILDAAREIKHPDLADMYCPDTGPQSAIRDEKGQIKAVRNIIRG